MIDFAGISAFEELPEALKAAERQTRKAIADLGDKFKPSTSENDFYPPSENDEWTNGMWTGEINIMYELTGKDEFKAKALEHVESFSSIPRHASRPICYTAARRGGMQP